MFKRSIQNKKLDLNLFRGKKVYIEIDMEDFFEEKVIEMEVELDF